MEKLIIIYEKEQAELIAAYAHAHPDSVVVALDFWAEQRLRTLGIEARPLTDYYPVGHDHRLLLTEMQDLSRDWHNVPEMSFFEHHGLRFGDMYEGALCDLLQKGRYYLFVFERIRQVHTGLTELVVPYSTRSVSSTAGPLAVNETQIVVAAATWFAAHAHMTCEVLGISRTSPVDAFPPQSVLRTSFLWIYNALMSLLPHREVRIYASDFWKNLGELMEYMPNAEFVLMDRKELRNIPWRQLLRHRIRFLHPLDQLESKTRIDARTKQDAFVTAWHKAKDTVAHAPGFLFEGESWFPVVSEGFETLITHYAARIVADIDTFAQMLSREGTQRVLVRASASAQHHLYILSQLPRQFGIPSFEVQHGIGVGTADPNSVFVNLNADYLLSYGHITRDAFVRYRGYDPERIQPIGSPRFDQYLPQKAQFNSKTRDADIAALGLDPSRPVIFVMIQEELIQLTPYCFTSYELHDFFLSLRDIQHALPKVQYILKFRHITHTYREYISHLFPHGDVAMVDERDAFSLVQLSDVVYSGTSTLVFESALAGKPVVLHKLKSGDTYFRELFSGVGLIADSVLSVVSVTERLLSEPSFAKGAVDRAEQFLKKSFSFDGNAASRAAQFIVRTSTPPRR